MRDSEDNDRLRSQPGRDGSQSVSFGPFRLDAQTECLWRGDEALRLRPKTWEVLRFLIASGGRLVTKDELIAQVWSGTAVSDGTLTQSIRELRAVLQDDSKQPRFIETVHRRGYRFIANLSDDDGEVAAPNKALDHPRTSAIVGRDAELSQLEDALAAAAQGQRRTLFVVGDAGIGKTTLIEEFLAGAAHSQTLAIARGQCVEQRREAEPYLPVLEALQTLCSGSGGPRVVDILKRFAPTWLVQMPWLLAPEELAPLQRQLMGTGPERMLREFTAAISELSHQIPLVLVLEDLHWSDLATVDLLAALARRRDPAALLVIGSSRRMTTDGQRSPLEQLILALTTRGDATEIELSVLNAAASRDYVTRRLDPTAPSELIDAIYRHSGGSPLFLVTALNYALAQGWVVRRDDRWVLSIPVAELETAIPAGLRQLIEVQAANLEGHERALLEVASVFGMEVSAQSVAVARGETVGESESALEHSSQRYRFIRRSEGSAGRFQFAHALYQQVLYESMPPANRRKLHLDAARALELEYGDRTAEIAAELAMHFERGGAYEDAASHLGVAALNAHARVADREAASLLEHALRLIAQVDDSRRRKRRETDLWIQLGAVRGSIYGRGSELYIAPFQRAWELSQELDDVPRMFLARMAAFGYFGLTEQLRRAEEVCRDLLSLAERVPMPDLVAVANGAMGSVLLGTGRLAEARRHLENALATLNPYDPSTQLFRRLEDPEILCLTSLSWVLAQLGLADQARQRSTTAIEIGRARAPYHHVYCSNAAAILALFLDDPDSCRQHAETTLALADEHGFEAFRGNASLLAAWARERLSPAPGAGERLQLELESYRRCSQRFGLVPYQSLVAEAHLSDGAVEAGLAVVAAAEAMMDASGERAPEGNLLRIKALLLARAGREPIEVEKCFAAAIAAARRGGAKLAELRIANALAAWWLERGEQVRAREMLEPIHAWFTEGFDIPDLRRSRDLLARLRSR